MTTLAHTLSASLVALTVAGVDPSEGFYVLTALGVAAGLDLDHLFFLVRDRKYFSKAGYKGQLHKARSFAHELLGGLIISILSALCLLFDRTLATIIFVSYMVHLVEDYLMGKSFPFTPFDRTEVKLFSPSLKTKAVVDVIVIIISVFLWKQYLNGRV